MKQRMRRLIGWFTCITLLGLYVSVVLAEPGGLTVTTNSVVLLGYANASKDVSAPSWVTNTAYTQGTYIKANGVTYFCVIAGSTTNGAIGGPVGMGDVTNGLATFRSCLARPRKGLAICNNATNSTWDLYLSEGSAAAASGKGFRVGPCGGSLVLTGSECPQGEIRGILTAGSGNVSTSEW